MKPDLPYASTKQGRMIRVFRLLIIFLACVLLSWWLIAYNLLPDWWWHHEIDHPALHDSPQITVTSSDIPGDPLNLLLIGSEHQLIKAMLAAGWHPADPITLESSLLIAESSILHRPYTDAPVSNLFLFGRKEDFAFEKPVGHDASQRHHVRFWRAPQKDSDGTAAWWGAVTYDRSVGFSHTTGQITHHIGAQIDLERDALINDLQKAEQIKAASKLPDFQQKEGRNGGGDIWQSDGELGIIKLTDA